MATQELISSNPKPKSQHINPRGVRRPNRQEAVFNPPVHHSPTGQSQNPSTEDDEEPLASKQLHRQTDLDEPINSQPRLLEPPTEQELNEDFEEEWARMSLLTQYIGPPTEAGPETPEEEGNSDLKTELETLKKDFLSQTDTLDRGQKHLEALDRAVAKYCILARLQITIQPHILLKDADFQKDWAESKLECELRLIETLQKHLRLRVICQESRKRHLHKH